MTWPLVTLGDLASPHPRSVTDGPFGSHLTSAHYTATGPRVIRLQNIGDGQFVHADAHISPEHFETLRKHEVLPGDLLVASLGETLPRACIAPAGLGPAIVKADCIRVRLREDVEPQWVLRALQRPAARRWADDHRHGVGRPRLGLKTIRAIPVPLPSQKEQRRIVSIIEEHLSHLDAADASLTLAARRAEALLRAEIEEAIWGQTCPTARVETLLREPMRNGRSDRASTTDGGIRTLTLTAITKRSFSDDHTKITTTPAAAAEHLWLEPGDILVQRSNTPELVGTSARYDGPERWAIFPDLLIRLRVKEDIVSSRYLALALRSERAHRSLRAKAKGLAGSMPKIDQNTVGATLVPFPDPARQAHVVSMLTAAEDRTRRLAQALETQRRRSAALRRAVLTAAFSGRLTGGSADGEVIEETAEASEESS